MALYSTWDWSRNAWRVYRTPTSVSVGDDPIPPRPTNISPIGASPDDDVKPLPTNARFVGFDHLARGEVRRAPRGLGDIGDDAGQGVITSNGWLMFGAGVAVASLFWLWRRSRHAG
jgi:hypothetical protein